MAFDSAGTHTTVDAGPGGAESKAQSNWGVATLGATALALAGLAAIILSQLGLRSVLRQSWGWHGIEVVGPLMVTLGGYGMLFLAVAVSPAEVPSQRLARYRKAGRFMIWVGAFGLLYELLRPQVW